MIIGEVVGNLTRAVGNFPFQVAVSLDSFISILKAFGVVVILYAIYILIIAFLNYRRMKKMGMIEKKVDNINRKLNWLLRNKRKGKKK